MENVKSSLSTSSGNPTPLGANFLENGVNFSIFSKDAEAVVLCLFDPTNSEIFHEIPIENKTEDCWHILVNNLPDNLLYAYRITLPGTSPEIVIDPYATSLSGSHEWGDHSGKIPYQPLCHLPSKSDFDWEGIKSPNRQMKDLILYEMHVRGFTKHISSGVKNRGKFSGVIEKIPYLKDLGINAVKLLPLQEFNENENHRINPVTYQRLYQYWGYSTVNFFSPMNRYASSSEKNAAVLEFKTMVRELHRNGIEVILDVVFNHTAEGNQDGPVYSFKGIDPQIYYMMNAEGEFRDFTGCGNTFNCNQPVVFEFILSCLRYWVTEMHVDGFRFDLASIFYRGVHGDPLQQSPLVEAMTQDPVLAQTKLIAEPWDAAGMYQVGRYYPASDRWTEWNGKYRDSIRRFLKGNPGEKREFAARLCGSQDLYHGRSPVCSINFVTAHDGFSLADLVSYNNKNNLENGEDNFDGMSHNDSWNCGFEGPTMDKKILTMRARQKRNFILGLMISQGIPMLQMGDEYSHTKKGNNNAWCQDNELTWFLWDALSNNQGFHRFYQRMIHFRNSHPVLRLGRFMTDEDIDWHGFTPFHPDWDGVTLFLAFTLKDHEHHQDLFTAFNVRDNQVSITLPDPPEGKKWHLVINTSNPSPLDYIDDDQLIPIPNPRFRILAHSAIVLKAL